MKQTYFFDPTSALVFRTGRPFDQAGDPQSLNFPLPSTTAGACRTALADEKKAFKYTDKNQLKQLLAHKVYGPLAASIKNDTGDIDVLFPCPADAIYLKDNEKDQIFQLKPKEIADDDGVYCDLPEGLIPVLLETQIKSKPSKGSFWWTEKNIEQWLLGFKPTDDINALGWDGPLTDSRTHVKLDPKTFAGEEGQLFQTQGIDFASPRKNVNEHLGWQEQRFGFIVHLPDNQLAAQYKRLGGEGRVAHIKPAESAWPTPSTELTAALKNSAKEQGIRLMLVTPALFKHGWRPDWIDDETNIGSPPEFPEISLQLKAMVNQRWEALSGWDLATKQPRATRRMVPAGSVYWFDVLEGAEHIHKLWLHPISDRTQDCNDGFGLVLPGIWKK